MSDKTILTKVLQRVSICIHSLLSLGLMNILYLLGFSTELNYFNRTILIGIRKIYNK